MGKNSLIIVGVLVAISLGATAVYLQIGDDVSSELSKRVNPCLSLYEIFADELLSKGFFDSESTVEMNRAHQKFVADDRREFECAYSQSTEGWLFIGFEIFRRPQASHHLLHDGFGAYIRTHRNH